MTLAEDSQVQNEAERVAQAVEWFLRVRSETARVEDLSELQRWIDANARNAEAYQQVASTWNIVGEHASAPEIVVKRRDALMDSHAGSQTGLGPNSLRNSWWREVSGTKLAALAAGLALVVLGAWWGLSPQATVYSTALGEQRTVTLPDGSVLVLDAHSRVRVRYTDKERAGALEQGQARFTVAQDLLRPFRVRAGNQMVVALGTAFDVELISQSVLVTLIEGRVAVADSAGRASDKQVTELAPGQALRIHQGHNTVFAVDLSQVTAWEKGKVFFYNEPLATAVERINRYSRGPIQVDPSIAAFEISGAFNVGDTNAFIEAVTNYFPVEAIQERGSGTYLTRKN